MSNIIHNRNKVTKQGERNVERVTNSLMDKIKQKENKVLLLDISGSMDAHMHESNKTRWDVLKEVYERLGCPRAFQFDDTCEEVSREVPLSRPRGGTAMDVALLHLKNTCDIKNIVIVTDGQPNNEDAALRAAQGMQIDCIYIGPQPIPDFLNRLTGRTGGKFESIDITSIGEASVGLLEGKIKGLLGSGK